VTFSFRGIQYDYYLPAPYARQVELPIAWAALQTCLPETGRVLEVGNVLGGYYPTCHHVVDKFEEGEGIINADVTVWRPVEPYDLILCISTVEHIGIERDSGSRAPARGYDYKPLAAIYNLLLYALRPGGRLFLTWPWRRRNAADRLLRQLPWEWVGFLKKVGKNEWIEVERKDLARIKYNQPFRKANAVVVGEVVRP
jgi:hypothetical protein